MDGFHPAVETAIIHFANPDLSLQALGEKFGISKQAAKKRVYQAEVFFKTYGIKDERERASIPDLEAKIQRLEDIILLLRRRLIIATATIFILSAFKEMVTKFFPKIKLSRFEPWQKKYILEMWAKFQRVQGSLKDFSKVIGKSSDTIMRWLAAYEKFGMAGLYDKKTTPHHFSRKIPLWLKEQLLQLFLKFPRWTPYQYYKYIRDNPAINYSLSLNTITKMKEIHTEKSSQEKERIKKLWVFSPNFSVWTVDYTTLLKTERYCLKLLTISDQRSRYFFDCALFLETSTETLVSHLEELFVKYGKPFMIKADNGPEMRLDLRENLQDFCVYLLNSPEYYGQFCGSHERIHRELKTYIDDFATHRNLMQLVDQIKAFREDHNHHWSYEILDNKTPAQIYYSEPDFVPKDVELITPYRKEGELRIKFTNREGNPARMSLPLLDQESTT